MSPADAQSCRMNTVLLELAAALNIPVSHLKLDGSFVENGGDSVSSMRLLKALRRLGLQISVRSIFTATTLLQLVQCYHLRLSPDSAAALYLPPNKESADRRARADSYASCSQRPCRAESLLKAAVREPGKMVGKIPMTEMQTSLVQATQRSFFGNLNMITYMESHRPDQLPALRKAWEQVLASETIFSMSFEVNEAGGYIYAGQYVRPLWEEVSVDDERSYLSEMNIFPPSALPLQGSFKVVTLLADPAKSNTGNVGRIQDGCTVLWRVHHAFIDGFAFELLRDKVQRVLEGLDFQPGPSFVEFSKRLQRIQEQGRELGTAFWKRQKEQHPSPKTEIELPAPMSDNSVYRNSHSRVHARCHHRRLTRLSKELGVTVASLYYAAWGLVVARYADSDDVSFGVVLSGRDLPIDGIEKVIGPTMNTLPLNVSLAGHINIGEYSRAVFESLVDLASFQWTTPAHGFSRQFFSAVNIRLGQGRWGNAPFGPLHDLCSSIITDVPIHVEILDHGRVFINYHTSSFPESHIEHLATAYISALNLISEKDMAVASCLQSIISNDQRMHLASLGNCASDTTRDFAVHEDLVSLLICAAEENPAAVALEFGSHSITYDELDKHSSLAATHLSAHVDPGQTVCVHADGSINWIIAIYAVLKCGAIYCPLDATLPDTVRATNFTTAGAALFLTGNSAAKVAKPSSCDSHLSIEELVIHGSALRSTEADAAQRSHRVTWCPTPDSAAYICFTSGSTGKPKGVVCRHRGLVAFQKQLQVRLGARPGWRIAQVMSPGFDGSIHEIFSALSYGATLVLKDKSHPFDHIRTCDAAMFTPSAARMLDVGDFPRLKQVYLVGEVVPQSVCDIWAASKELFNMYGPTEATCGATIKRLIAKRPVTLGIPNSSTRVYILDSQRRLAPLGVAGELYLAGVQVAVGYIGLAEETKEKFLLDCTDPLFEGEYMYKTGDRAYWNEAGELVYLGRKDRQVKLRGFRINLDDLEFQVARAVGECQATAVALGEDERLIALVQPAHLDLDHVIRLARQHIPAYAIPNHFVAVDVFPTTAVGKVDYKAIATSYCTRQSTETEDSALSSLPEQVISAELRQVLALPTSANIDPSSSFSDLGGDSVRALSLSHRLSRIFKARVPLRSILDSVTIRGLAQQLGDISNSSDLLAPQVALGYYDISPIEKEWWQRYQHNSEGTSSFNVSYACRFHTAIDQQQLESAWKSILARYPILVCKFNDSDAQSLTRTYLQNPNIVNIVDKIDTRRELDTPFHLERDALTRVWISANHMLVIISHIICDLTSLKIVLRDVADTYNGKKLTQVNRLYSQTDWSLQPDTNSYLRFWTEYLSPAFQEYHNSCKGIVKSRRTWSGLSSFFQLSKFVYKSMLCLASTNKVSMHQLALGAVAMAMTKDNGTCDITLGAPHLNRHSTEDCEVVGLFVQPLPIRVRFPEPSNMIQASAIEPASTTGPSTAVDGHSATSFLKAVQRSSRAALSHAVPWDQLVSYMNIQPIFPNHPIFDVMVTFHEAGASEIDFCLGGGVEHLPTWSAGSKFKLMVEFTARNDDQCDMRIEYSDECFAHNDVQLIAGRIISALAGLATGNDFEAIEARLRSGT